MSRPIVQVVLLSVAELFAMTLWFSATAVIPSLEKAWSLSAGDAAWMTAAVQLGFVAGALASALLNLPDVIPPRTMVAGSAVLGAAVNVALAFGVASALPAIALRFLTGVFLAGVYPPGMKIAAGHVTGSQRGIAIGTLVGALTLGSATPHLVAGVLGGAVVPFRPVLLTSAALALAGAVIMVLLVRDGPQAPARAPFDPSQIGRVFSDRPVLLANLGYFGHMWELYAMWTWIVVFLSLALHDPVRARILTFGVIGVAGAVGCIVAGWIADRIGRTTVTIASMVLSCACCLLSPFAFDVSAAAIMTIGLFWGAVIVSDSAQFSTAVTELCNPAYMGTALTLQVSIGFALTLVTIWGLPYFAGLAGWRYAFLVLAPGPALGCVAMARLRARPEAVKLASGRR